MENKVQFNLKNVHYAVQTVDGDTVTYATPVAVPGAVNLALSPQGEITPFYADGIVYYQSAANNGYSGDLEMARFHDKMLQDVWGYVLTDKEKVLMEMADAEAKEFALLFQIDGDKNDDYYCMYNCTGTRPGITSKTNETTKTPQTQKSTISAHPLANGRILARTTKDSPEATKTNWFNAVFEPAATTATTT